ncbi:hypothetical protein LMG27952_06912 [Paraburkholderia hiiakae]|uniref:Uncharacterized protein n=1 Tax=Paraburkholderia hiiakae TaxID=1081782 RepID=A0ABM8P971_9BURK|nr:hypothetical protein [Paraburkholderia hiiakae]CAD6559602.1 hypothetical protein LMG27952_06912 [Paraburkholderia hiiakae]
MGFFSSLGSMLESVADTALESIADGIQKISDAIPSPTSSSSSSSSSSAFQAEVAKRAGARRIAESESAVILKSFFQKHQLAVTDAEIKELVTACSATSTPAVSMKFEIRYQDTAEMQVRVAEMDSLNAEIERFEQAAQAIRSLMAQQDAAANGEGSVVAQP